MTVVLFVAGVALLLTGGAVWFCRECLRAPLDTDLWAGGVDGASSKEAT